MKRMTQYIIRYWLLLTLCLLTLPGCARTREQAVAEAIEQASRRYQDAPPVVDPQRHYQLPVDTRIALAGNYGELRPDHFHAGLDFKTDQSTGHPVYSFADGFVRRAAINAYGYGLVLYVEHPALGLTSVYGHLETFGDKVWQKVRERQVREQLNNCDVTFAPDEIPVGEGEVIALSGNTGSSGGPHVHFELRNIPTDDNDITNSGDVVINDIFYDPQMFFLRELQDTQAPRISNVYVYPQQGEGLVNGQSTPQMSPVTGRCATTGGEGGTLTKTLTAWGRVGLALKAYDYMDGQSNKYGVKEVRLMMEVPERDEQGQLRYQYLYHFRQDAFRYSETRFTNSVTDYGAWIGRKSMVMKSWIEPGNFLQQVDPSLGDGIVTINEERRYHFIYELEDAHGNLTSLDFYLQGQRPGSDWAPRKTVTTFATVTPMQPYVLDSAGCRLEAAPGVFYTDVDFNFRVADRATVTRNVNVRRKNKKGKMITVQQAQQVDVPCVSRIYTLGSSEVPMHKWCDLTIELPDTVTRTQQLYLTDVDGYGAVRGSRFESGGHGRPSRMTGQIRRCGRYAVRRDAKGPVMSVTKAGYRRMQIEVGDGGSGVSRFRVTIDGKFVPFDMDRTGHYFGEPCHYGIQSGRKHQVEMWAIDQCGNETSVHLELTF